MHEHLGEHVLAQGLRARDPVARAGAHLLQLARREDEQPLVPAAYASERGADELRELVWVVRAEVGRRHQGSSAPDLIASR